MRRDSSDTHLINAEHILPWVALGVLCLIWGTTWIGVKIDLESTGPLTGVGLRFLIAGSLLLTLAKWRRRTQPSMRTPWRVVAILATFMFGGSYVATYVAQTHLESGVVAVLFSTLPFFGFGFSYVLLGERTTAFTWLGAGIALLGIALVSLSGPAHGGIGFSLCALIGAACAAFGNVYAKKHSTYDPILTLPPAMLTAGASVLILGVLMEHTIWSNVLAPSSLLALLYLAVIGTATAFFLLLWSLKRLSVKAVNISSLLYPIVALVAGALLGNEHISGRDLVGTACVLGGLFFAFRTP